MLNYIEKIFNRTDLQVIRGVLINEVGDESDIDRRTYEQRIDEESASMLRYLESTYPDGDKRDAVFSDISQALTAYQDVYFEMGLKCGARLIYQLLFERQPMKT